MAAFTPFNHSEDTGEEDAIVVCSDAQDNEGAIADIDQWAQIHGYVRSAEHHLNVRRNLSGHKYYYSACYLEGQDTRGRDKIALSSAALMNRHTAEIGTRLYEQHIRPQIEGDDTGKYVAVDVRADVPLDYEVGTDLISTAERILTRRPAAMLYTIRVGYLSVATMRHRYTRAGQ